MRILIKRLGADIDVRLAHRLDGDRAQIKTGKRFLDVDRVGALLKTHVEFRASGEVDPLLDPENSDEGDGPSDEDNGKEIPDGAKFEDLHTSISYRAWRSLRTATEP